MSHVTYNHNNIFFITSDGKVGINNSSPTNDLSLTGDLFITGSANGSTDGIQLTSTSTSTYRHVIAHTDEGLEFTNTSASGAHRDYSFKNGRVGIGVTNPAREALQIADGIRIEKTENAPVYMYSNQDTSGYYIEQVDDDSNRAHIRFQTRPNNTGDYTRLSIDADEQQFILDNGNVNIVSSIDQKIILDGSSSPYIRWREKNVGDVAYIQWVSSWDGLLIHNTHDRNLDIRGNGDPRIRLRDSAGNVRGGFLADSSNNVGILDAGLSWAVRVVNDQGVVLASDGNTDIFVAGKDLVTGSFGTVQTKGSGKNSWDGYSINGRAVFMHSGDSQTGLWDDVNDGWFLRGLSLGRTSLYYNKGERLMTSQAGATVHAWGSDSNQALLIQQRGTNGTETGLRITSQIDDSAAGYTQWGEITYQHGDTNAYEHYNAFKFFGSESRTAYVFGSNSGEAGSKERWASLIPGTDLTGQLGHQNYRWLSGYVNKLYIDDGFYHNGDTNTSIRFSGNDIVSISVGGVERLQVNENGVNITGDLAMINNTDDVNLAEWVFNTTGLHSVDRNNYITLYGNQSADHSISSRDKSGAINDDIRINSYGSLFINLDSNTNNSNGADFVVGKHGSTGTISADNTMFTINGETGQTTIRGTTTSDFVALRTTLGGASNSANFYTDWHAAEGFKVVRHPSTSGNLTIGIDSADSSSWTDTGGHITFKTNSAGTYDERVRITRDGDVGIGVQNPDYKLHVAGTAFFRDGMYFSGENLSQTEKHAGSDGEIATNYLLKDTSVWTYPSTADKNTAKKFTFTAPNVSIDGTRYYLKFRHHDSEGGARFTLNSTAVIDYLSYNDVPGSQDDNSWVWSTYDVTDYIVTGSNTLYFWSPTGDGITQDATFVFSAVGLAVPNEPVELKQHFYRGLTTSESIGIGTTTPSNTLEVLGGATITSSGPVLVLKDTDGGDTNDQTGYISYRDNANTERGWVGFGSSGTKEFGVYNKIGDLILGAGSTSDRVRITKDKAPLWIEQPPGKTIGGNDLDNGCALFGSATMGIGIDNNEIIKTGSDLIIGVIGVGADADNNGQPDDLKSYATRLRAGGEDRLIVSYNNTTISNDAYFNNKLYVNKNIQSRQQIRATGWWNSTGSSYDGPAAEIGVSGGMAYLMHYDRSESSYGPLQLQATTVNLNPTDGQAMYKNSEILSVGNSNNLIGVAPHTSQGRMKQFTLDHINANGTQAREAMIARLSIDTNDWSSIGTMEIELSERYYYGSRRKRYVVVFNPYNSGGGEASEQCQLWLMENEGTGRNDYDLRAHVYNTGSQQSDGGYTRYADIYCRADHYSSVSVTIRYNGNYTGDTTPPTSYAWINTGSPSYSNISSFTVDGHSSVHDKAYVHKTGGTFTGTINIDGNLNIGGNYRLIGGIGARTTGGTLNWNDDTNARSGSGYTLLKGDATNGPTSNGHYFHPFTFEYAQNGGSGNMTQFAIPYQADQPFGPYFRSRYSNTWSGWYEMWHSGNDGSGSGLDADKLDGLYSSSFLRSDADDSTSGTLTVGGDLIPSTDNTGNVGTSSRTWKAGRFTNLVVDSTLSVRGAVDLADSDILRFGSGDDVEFFCDGSHMYTDLNSGIGNWYIRDGTTTKFTFDDSGEFRAVGDIVTSNSTSGTTKVQANRIEMTSGTTGFLGYWDVKDDAEKDFDGRIGYDGNIHTWNFSTGLQGTEDGSGNWSYTTAQYIAALRMRIGSTGLEVSGDVTAYYDFSDERLKKDITTLESDDSLDKVLLLQGVMYQWKDVKHDKHIGDQIGFVAQQVEQVVPQVVKQSKRIDSEETYKQVEYDKIVPLLVESIKAQQKQIDELKQQIEQLKQQ